MFSDDEIAEFFKGTVVMSGDSAKRLNARGFSHLTGVESTFGEGKNIIGELLTVKTPLYTLNSVVLLIK